MTCRPQHWVPGCASNKLTLVGIAVAQDLLPKKADLIEFEKVALELKDHFRRILDLGARRLCQLQHQHYMAVAEYANHFLGLLLFRLAQRARVSRRSYWRRCEC